MKAETSFSHRNVNADVIGSDRFQTAIFSYEYAQYSGYDDDNGNDKMEQSA